MICFEEQTCRPAARALTLLAMHTVAPALPRDVRRPAQALCALLLDASKATQVACALLLDASKATQVACALLLDASKATQVACALLLDASKATQVACALLLDASKATPKCLWGEIGPSTGELTQTVRRDYSTNKTQQ